MIGGSNAPGTMIAREDGVAQVVWKYPLDPDRLSGRCEVQMSGGAKVIEAVMQHGRFTLWAVVAPSERPQQRIFYIVGTGQDIPADAHTYLGTVHDGPYVFHIFEGFK